MTFADITRLDCAGFLVKAKADVLANTLVLHVANHLLLNPSPRGTDAIHLSAHEGGSDIPLVASGRSNPVPTYVPPEIVECAVNHTKCMLRQQILLLPSNSAMATIVAPNLFPQFAPAARPPFPTAAIVDSSASCEPQVRLQSSSEGCYPALMPPRTCWSPKLYLATSPCGLSFCAQPFAV